MNPSQYISNILVNTITYEFSRYTQVGWRVPIVFSFLFKEISVNICTMRSDFLSICFSENELCRNIILKYLIRNSEFIYIFLDSPRKIDLDILYKKFHGHEIKNQIGLRYARNAFGIPVGYPVVRYSLLPASAVL